MGCCRRDVSIVFIMTLLSVVVNEFLKKKTDVTLIIKFLTNYE